MRSILLYNMLDLDASNREYNMEESFNQIKKLNIINKAENFTDLNQAGQHKLLYKMNFSGPL